MRAFATRHPIWTVVLAVAAAVLLWMLFAVWPKWLIGLIGKKKAVLYGGTVGRSGNGGVLGNVRR